MIGCSIECGDRPHHLQLLGLWEDTQTPGWAVSVAEVEERIVELCGIYRVEEIAADPALWRKSLEALADRYPIVEAPQSPARMVPATLGLYQAIANGMVMHDGDERFAKHVANAVQKPNGMIAKPSKGSPRRIDCAATAIMAHAHARAQPEPRVPMVAFR